MNLFRSAAILFSGFAALAILPESASAQSATDKNKEVVGMVGEAVFIKHDFSHLDQYMSEGYIQHNALVPQGRAGFKQFFETTFKAIPDWSYSLKQIAAEGDRVWVYGTYSGTQTGEWLGIPPSNNKFSIDAVDVFRVQDGKLAEHWDVMDVYGLFKQLGVIK